MAYLFLVISTLVAVELFFRLPFITQSKNLIGAVDKSLRVITSKHISDHWKEKVLPEYSKRLFISSILVFVILIAAVSPFFILFFIGDLIDVPFSLLMMSWTGIIASTVLAIAYVIVRKNILGSDEKQTTNNSDYSLGSQILHRLALNYPFISETFFDIESSIYLKKKASKQGKHVFVAGLARAGTTVLMRSLYETGQFCSLTYRDMPFVLSPNLWASLADRSSKKMQAKERAHGDGVKVDFDSPEALEEVFWRIFTGNKYLKKTRLYVYKPSQEALSQYINYIALIAKRYNKKRYLSKNNNNILRLDSITSQLPNSYALVPFRDPLQHAYSLLNQHKSFVARHNEDKFSEEYMTWLAHHEFGLDHRYFCWDQSKGLEGTTDSHSLNYWLQRWLETYTYLLENYSQNEQILFIGYELSCTEKEKVWSSLSEILDFSYSELPNLSARSKDISEDYDEALLEACISLYKSLEKQSLKSLKLSL